MANRDSFWTVVQPDAWPPPPPGFSASSASSIGKCPRRWGLRRADYRATLGLTSYPERPHAAAIAGLIFHHALETITNLFRDTDTSDADVVRVSLQAVGGLSGTLQRSAGQILDAAAQSIRGERLVDDLRLDISRRIPALRANLQAVLQELLLAGQAGGLKMRGRSGGAAIRGRLAPGLHPEVELKPRSVPWSGRADAILITDAGCEILDYKTGAQSPEHDEQLRTYAVLWALDDEINPAGTPPSRLTLVYASGRKSVSVPSAEEISILASDLIVRAETLRALVREVPPRAVVSDENCRHCDVRHLCSAFWTRQGQAALARGDMPAWRSTQVTIVGQRGSHSYDARVDRDQHLADGTPCTVAGTSLPSLESGTSVRLLDVRIDDDVDGVPQVQFLATSELFMMPRAD